MRILSPVDSAAEAASLVSLGASELYGGYLGPRWNELFGLHASANRRSFTEAQVGDADEFRRIIDTAHEGGARFYFTANSPFFTAEQRIILDEMIDDAVSAGIDAVIAADIGFIVSARTKWHGLPVHLSTLGEVTNSAAVAFYHGIGVERITLPRHMTTRQIGDLITASPGTVFDAFVLYGQCVNAEGHCTFSHDDPRRVWPCVQPFAIAGGEESAVEGAAPAFCGQKVWDGLPRGEACGLCGLWDLRRLGVRSVKIVGRGTSRERKEWAVGTTAALIAMMDAGGISREDFLAEAKRRYRKQFPKGCRPTLCYFPEYLEETDA
jgi:putative protease